MEKLKPNFWPTQYFVISAGMTKMSTNENKQFDCGKLDMKINSTCKVNRLQHCLGDSADVEDKRQFSIKGLRLLMLN